MNAIHPAINLNRGFTLEDPAVTICFGMSESELWQLLRSRVRFVRSGYHCLTCTSLGGMQHELGCRFECGLTELEFCRKEYPDQVASFNEFQRHFEAAFGPPTESLPGSEGFPSHHWALPGFELVHFVYNRFGPEEHLRIRVKSSWLCGTRIKHLWRKASESKAATAFGRLLGRVQRP